MVSSLPTILTLKHYNYIVHMINAVSVFKLIILFNVILTCNIYIWLSFIKPKNISIRIVITYFFCRNSSNRNTWLHYIFNYNCICTYCTIICNSNTSNNFTASSKINIIPYNWEPIFPRSNCNTFLYAKILSYNSFSINLNVPICAIDKPFSQQFTPIPIPSLIEFL